MSAGKGDKDRADFKAVNTAAYWDKNGPADKYPRPVKADPQQQPEAPLTASGGSELSAERRGRITRKEIAQATGIDWEAIDPLKEKAMRKRIEQLAVDRLAVDRPADTFTSFMAECKKNIPAMFYKKKD